MAPSSGLGPEAIAGIVVGCLLALLLLFLLAVWLLSLWMRGPTKGSDNPKRMDGKVVVITGGNTGIGKATAEDMYRRGARVIILCRRVERGQEAIQDIRENVDKNSSKVDKEEEEEGASASSKRDKGSLEVRHLDLASLASVRSCAEDLLRTEDKINVLVNNAGVSLCPQAKTKDGFDLTFGTNHFGHFLLTELLTPLLKSAAIHEPNSRPRIVIVSALAHKHAPINWDDINYEGPNFNSWSAYAASKLANILHAKELSRRMQPLKVNVYSLHPGIIATDLMRNVSDRWYYRCCSPLALTVLKTPFRGAQTTLYCALDEKLESQTGGYYSDCAEATPHRRALIEEDQKRLWRLSARAVGLPSSEA